MVKLTKIAWALAIGSVALLGAGAWAHGQQDSAARQAHESATRARQSNAAMPAHQFARNAAQIDLAEIDVGKLAEKKGGSATVRDFGARLVRDHTENLDRLKAAAQQQNIALPTEPSEADASTYKHLASLNTSEFDRTFASDMVKGHAEAVAEFKEEAESGSNPAIKDYAEKSVPVLETHLRIARNVQNSVNAQRPTSGQSESEL